jgi:hypothetical protein
MRDIKIYLHANTTRLQSVVHLLAISWFFYKAFHLPPNALFHIFWFYFYIVFGVILSVAILFQLANKFAFRYLSITLNILSGVVLVVDSLVKLAVLENMVKFTLEMAAVYLFNFSGGLFFILIGVFEDSIRKIPYMAFSKNQVYGRRSWFSSFSYPWPEVADVNFRQNRIKITTQAGNIIRFRIAKQSTGGIMAKSAEYFCRQILRTHHSSQEGSTQQQRTRP